MQRRADLKGGMDRFTIGLFQYTASFFCLSFSFVQKQVSSVGNYFLMSHLMEIQLTHMLTSSSANLVVTYKKAI